jgi:aspartokinase
MALIRLGNKMAEFDSSLEVKILTILKNSSMVLKNKIVVVISKRELEGVKAVSHVKSGRHITYILEQREADKITEKSQSLWKSKENLNLITIESAEELEEVPGVISYILSALASEGINVVEFISCYTDTLLVVRQSDTEKAYRVLSSILQ